MKKLFSFGKDYTLGFIKEFLLVFVLSLFLIGFGHGYAVTDGITTLSQYELDWLDENAINIGTNVNGSVINLFDWGNETNGKNRNLCVIIDGFSRSSDFTWRLDYSSSLSVGNNGSYYGINDISLLCASGRRRYFVLRSTSNSNTFSIGKFRVISPQQLLYLMDINSGLEQQLNSSNSNYSKCQSYLNTCQNDLTTCQNSSCQTDLLQCQNDYSTCENSLGQCGTSLNSCNNALGSCMQGNVGTGEYNRSALFINNIQHLGKPIINITIPEEIDWDYTGNENSFDLTVKGYAVDSDYIQGIIDINSYQVTSEDFTDIFVNGLTLIFPYIVVVLFIIFIRKLIKKIFR